MNNARNANQIIKSAGLKMPAVSRQFVKGKIPAQGGLNRASIVKGFKCC